MINDDTAKSNLPNVTPTEAEAFTDPELAGAILNYSRDYRFVAVISAAHLHHGRDDMAREYAAEYHRLADSYKVLSDEHTFRGTAKRAINELNADLKRALQ